MWSITGASESTVLVNKARQLVGACGGLGAERGDCDANMHPSTRTCVPWCAGGWSLGPCFCSATLCLTSVRTLHHPACGFVSPSCMAWRGVACIQQVPRHRARGPPRPQDARPGQALPCPVSIGLNPFVFVCTMPPPPKEQTHMTAGGTRIIHSAKGVRQF